uniref:GDT1 family protein n=1 Tax=Lotharella globosa TaxID=91324 RepID=A0A7S4DZV0_9EUKA|mmetsp:Transcript_15509/g.31449  ORF Transcript_15509/g.31449 Transcript_15509/m.31449 type:complete len:330 (-) Transcript_15509:189-1178(-)
MLRTLFQGISSSRSKNNWGTGLWVIVLAGVFLQGNAAWAEPALYASRINTTTKETGEMLQLATASGINATAEAESVQGVSSTSFFTTKVPEIFNLDYYSFWAAFGTAFSMIAATELGDKTFIIAAIMAMKHNRFWVYVGAVGALALMTVLSVGIGWALPNLIPIIYTYYASIVLFVYFGARLLFEAACGYLWPSEENEELAEVEKELGVNEGDVEEEALVKKPSKNHSVSNLNSLASAVLAQAFSLTFTAEWGDRSQIATVAMASSKGFAGAIGVTVGAVLGHACCTGLAVLGGRLIATSISERQVAIFGGLLFLGFAGYEIYVGPPEV